MPPREEVFGVRGPFPASWAGPLLSVLRIVVGFLFLAHGTQKLIGVPPMPFSMTLKIFSLLGVASILETCGGALILLGLLTRPVAFILAGEMAYAYFSQHAPHSFWPVVNKGEPAVLFCFIFLFFAAAGAGPWSLDALFGRRRSGGPFT